MKRYSISSPARRDIDLIWDAIAAVNVVAADKFLLRLSQRFQILARYPMSGRACDELRIGLRRTVCGRYAIFYRIKNSTVEIVRLIHGARDIEKLFMSEENT